MEAYRGLWLSIITLILVLFLARWAAKRAKTRKVDATKPLGARKPIQTGPVPVIIDGDWIEENLKELGRNKNDVIMQLQGQGVLAAKIRELSLVTLDGRGEVWYDKEK